MRLAASGLGVPAMAATVALLGSVLGCAGEVRGIDATDGGARSPVDAGPPCGDGAACPAGDRCWSGACIPDNGPCATDDQCQNDTWCACPGSVDGGSLDGGACAGGVCVPWGTPPRGSHDPACGAWFPSDEFLAPTERCHWEGPGDGVIMTPLVADLDGDHVPEVIFSTLGDRFVAIHGDDCQPFFNHQRAFLERSFSQLAVADLDGDHAPEIVGIDSETQSVEVFDRFGDLLATSPVPVGDVGYGGPEIVDVDGTPPAEIVVGAQVVRWVKGSSTLTVLWRDPVPPPAVGPMTIAADLDGDGLPEVIVGPVIYDGVSGADKTPAGLRSAGLGGAYPAVGDFNLDGKPDLVLVQPPRPTDPFGVIAIYDWAADRFLFGPYPLDEIGGGPPTVADFDGDGVPEFGVATYSHYSVYDVACVGPNKPADCDPASRIGLLWSVPTQDHSSSVTSAAAFDFNGDGAAEVVYRDECWLRALDGRTGRTLLAVNVTSSTGLELPPVADVDADGHAEIVAPADADNLDCIVGPDPVTGAPWIGYRGGVYLYADPFARWLGARPLWNQHAYHVTNVADDLTIPTPEPASWLYGNGAANDYRAQHGEGPLTLAPDLTAGPPSTIDQRGSCATGWTLEANVCNRGAAPTPIPVPGTFYTSDPRLPGAHPVCTAVAPAGLAPGACQTVSCDWSPPPPMPANLWFRVDDDGRGLGAQSMPAVECRRGNDVLFISMAQCLQVQ
ncbi:MAG TPA: VCBS repeat-containing protein [Acidimicrobiales bacterium]|nr:VCBS repeat-containing protein [Acidimicrobiales bacterium]